MRDEFLVYGAPKIEQEEIDEVVATLESGWIGTGPRVAVFEKDFAEYKNIDPAQTAAVNSCTAALHLSMLAAGLSHGDEVITTPLTFCATINAIIHAGATPVLADIDPATMNIDPRTVEDAITPRTRAILPVHFAGRPCDMDALNKIAELHGLLMIEDCAHAIETEYHGRKAGTFGDFGCFSFYVTKNVVTGEGGMVIARNEDTIGNVRTLALHGMSRDAWRRFSDSGYKHYQIIGSGYKYNMTDIQAALGVHQLSRVDKNWHRRKAIWDQYQGAFSHLPVGIPIEPEADTKHAYHLYTLIVDKDKCGITRDEFLDAMTRRNIGIGVHYLAIPEHQFYRSDYGMKPEDTPNAVYIGRRTASLPLSPKLSDSDVQDVINAVYEILDT